MENIASERPELSGYVGFDEAWQPKKVRRNPYSLVFGWSGKSPSRCHTYASLGLWPFWQMGRTVSFKDTISSWPLMETGKARGQCWFWALWRSNQLVFGELGNFLALNSWTVLMASLNLNLYQENLSNRTLIAGWSQSTSHRMRFSGCDRRCKKTGRSGIRSKIRPTSSYHQDISEDAYWLLPGTSVRNNSSRHWPAMGILVSKLFTKRKEVEA